MTKQEIIKSMLSDSGNRKVEAKVMDVRLRVDNGIPLVTIVTNGKFRQHVFIAAGEPLIDNEGNTVDDGSGNDVIATEDTYVLVNNRANAIFVSLYDLFSSCFAGEELRRAQSYLQYDTIVDDNGVTKEIQLSINAIEQRLTALLLNAKITVVEQLCQKGVEQDNNPFNPKTSKYTYNNDYVRCFVVRCELARSGKLVLATAIGYTLFGSDAKQWPMSPKEIVEDFEL